VRLRRPYCLPAILSDGGRVRGRTPTLFWVEPAKCARDIRCDGLSASPSAWRERWRSDAFTVTRPD